jgi:RNA recognition motif-containing protein
MGNTSGKASRRAFCPRVFGRIIGNRHKLSNKLYVGNLAYTTGDQDLRDAFAPFGNVQSASVVIDRDSGQSRGFGFVEYGSSAEAQQAVDAMNGTMVDGRTLNVNVARPREGGGGGGGSRGGFGGGGGGGGGGFGGGGGGGGGGKRRDGGGGGKRW